MKQVLVGIFAHPDDEAFGPSGTLLRLADEGYDVHLVLLTDGEAGSNPGQVTNLGAVRLEEWQSAGKLLGVKSAHALHFPDGGLKDVPSDSLDAKLAAVLDMIAAEYAEPAEVSVMTFEPEGLTGHVDHIAASQAARRIFDSLAAKSGVHRGKLWYFCLDKTQAPLDGTAYYEPRARNDDYITDRIDVRENLAQKYELIDRHASQVADAANLKALGDDLLATECFHIVS
ncbi:MAG TPA: PIG-L family deacetylase [Candidatus Saccharibacteria bacterium]|nr:PIG-L family deacetylase [Candidatus Saccharibacteria bacterium]HRK94105.1 PIG-L family deacetylase [Candidatus Saccharibacteria bacterium]